MIIYFFTKDFGTKEGGDLLLLRDQGEKIIIFSRPYSFGCPRSFCRYCGDIITLSELFLSLNAKAHLEPDFLTIRRTNSLGSLVTLFGQQA